MSKILVLIQLSLPKPSIVRRSKSHSNCVWTAFSNFERSFDQSRAGIKTIASLKLLTVFARNSQGELLRNISNRKHTSNYTSRSGEIDDSAKGGLTQFWEHFYRDSFRVQRFQTLITSLFDDIWISNQIWGSLKVSRGSYVMNFRFLHHETGKDHGRKLRSKLAASLGIIVHYVQRQSGGQSVLLLSQLKPQMVHGRIICSFPPLNQTCSLLARQ